MFVAYRDGIQQLYVMNADGSAQTRLIDDPTAEYRAPAWSPDGTRIAYRREPGGNETQEIWVVDADGTNAVQLTDNAAADDVPTWSPDGTRIAFESDRAGQGDEIYVMNADGSGQTRITTDGAESLDADFSPDGTQIVFRTFRQASPDIYVMPADGSDGEVGTRLTTDGGFDEEPSWQPLPLATTTTTSTTTTTLPALGGVAVPGKLLLLKDNASKPQKRALKLITKDGVIGDGAGEGSAGDPTVHGGFLKVVSANGDTFNTTYDLPAESWRTKGKPGKVKGYKLKKVGPIKTVLVKLGKSLKVVAKGDALGHTLGDDPDPVHVALGLGSEVYCLTFGGETKFKPGKTYRAKKAPTPETCEALVPRCGDGLLEDGEACPLLEGPADGSAIDATFDFEDLDPVPPSAIGLDVDGDEVVRTRIKILFPDDATVGAVNDAIESVDGRIVSMVGGVPTVVIEIPDLADRGHALDVNLANLTGRHSDRRVVSVAGHQLYGRASAPRDLATLSGTQLHVVDLGTQWDLL